MAFTHEFVKRHRTAVTVILRKILRRKSARHAMSRTRDSSTQTDEGYSKSTLRSSCTRSSTAPVLSSPEGDAGPPATPLTSSTRSALLTLPGEIRNLIYQHLFAPLYIELTICHARALLPTGAKNATSSSPPSGRTTALLVTCRQLHHEVSTFLDALGHGSKHNHYTCECPHIFGRYRYSTHSSPQLSEVWRVCRRPLPARTLGTAEVTDQAIKQLHLTIGNFIPSTDNKLHHRLLLYPGRGTCYRRIHFILPRAGDIPEHENERWRRHESWCEFFPSAKEGSGASATESGSEALAAAINTALATYTKARHLQRGRGYMPVLFRELHEARKYYERIIRTSGSLLPEVYLTVPLCETGCHDEYAVKYARYHEERYLFVDFGAKLAVVIKKNGEAMRRLDEKEEKILEALFGEWPDEQAVGD